MLTERAYDLIAVDLDGTLLNSNHSVPAENRTALHRAHEAGLHVVLCTGRAYPETRPILDEIGLDLDAAITVFGAVTTDIASGRTLEQHPIPRDTAHRALAWLQEQGYTVLWLTDGATCGSDGYVIDGPNRHLAVDGYLIQSPVEMTKVAELPADAADPLRLSIIDDRATLEPFSAQLRAAFGAELTHNVLTAPSWELTVIEAFAPHVNKWFGIEQLCRRWGVDPTRTVAIGDDVNDLEMVRSAGLGVAMGNARDEVKHVAQAVTRRNDDAGVASVIDQILST